MMKAATQHFDDDRVRSLGIKALIVLGAAVVLFWIVQWWQRPATVEFDNLKYIQLLRTAVSSERPEWVTKVKEAVDQRVAEGAMSTRERKEFGRVLDLAETQKWREAHQLCFRLEEAQLSRRRKSPPAAHTHTHEHGHDHP